MDADTRLAAVWRVEECTDEFRENCACVIVTGEGDRIQYAADAETPELAARIVADHNEIVALREQLDKYVGKEPTLRDEMAYLHRCLNAVFNECRTAEKQALRWENPLPVPEWVPAVRSAAAGEHEEPPGDKRRRIYLDGEGQAWIETTEGYVTAIEMASHEGEPLAQVRERSGEVHEIGRTW